MIDVKIKCDSCKFVDGCVDYGWSECKKFTQKPSEPITNEEWFCQLTTEEKARVIVNIHNLANIEQIEWWLKEIRQ